MIDKKILKFEILAVSNYKKQFYDAELSIELFIDGPKNIKNIVFSSKEIFNFISPKEFFEIPNALSLLAKTDILDTYGFEKTKELVRNIPREMKEKYKLQQKTIFLDYIFTNFDIYKIISFNIEDSLTQHKFCYQTKRRNKNCTTENYLKVYKILTKYKTEKSKYDRKVAKDAVDEFLSYFPDEIKLLAEVL